MQAYLTEEETAKALEAEPATIATVMAVAKAFLKVLVIGLSPFDVANTS